jgi:hypothetical protein
MKVFNSGGPISAPTGNEWLMTEGAYLANPSQPSPHTCKLPADWPPGAVWRCTAGHLWVVGPACACRDRLPHRGQHTLGRAWWPAGWWTRQRWNFMGHMTKRARLGQASENRAQYGPKGKGNPPKGPSPISSPRAPEDFDG